jgi:hypothetical protein
LKCKLSKGSSFEKLHDALCTLEGTYIAKVDKVYRAIHDKLTNAQTLHWSFSESEADK